MGIVEEVGPEVTQIKAGDRVVVPFNISCGHCRMCEQDLFAQCETTQVRELALAAAWFPEEMPLLNGEFEWIAIDPE